jgi:hypothetical protein
MKLKDILNNAISEAGMPPENIQYKGYVISVVDDDGDWVANISRPGDPQPVGTEFGVNKNMAVQRAQKIIDRIASGNIEQI